MSGNSNSQAARKGGKGRAGASPKQHNKKPKGSSKHKGATTTEDQRFAAAASDPRFQRLPQRDKKVKVDTRFKKMFTDPAFKTTCELPL